MRQLSRKRFIILAVCCYLILGSVWIFLSDSLFLNPFLKLADTREPSRLPAILGIAFILMTAALLLLILVHLPDRNSGRPDKKNNDVIPVMPSDWIPPWAAYVFAVMMSLSMLVFRMKLAVSVGERPLLILFIPPIILCSVLGGFGPGLLATAISTVGVIYFGIPPLRSFAIAAPLDRFQLFMLIFSGILVSYMSELLHRARRNAEQRRMLQEFAQESLHLSEERFQLAMHGANDGLWDWNLMTDEVYYSPRWKTMLGYGAHELAPHLDTWKQLVHPDDLNPTLSLVDDIVDGRSDRFEIEFRMLHRDGKYRDILSRAFPGRDDSGRVVRMVGTHLDITERNKAGKALSDSESRFRAYIENVPVGIIVADVRGAFVDVNPEGISLLGYDREDLLTMDIRDIVPPEDLERSMRGFNETKNTGYHEDEHRMTAKSGNIIRVYLRGIKIGEDRFVAYFQDITSKKEEEEIKRFNLRLLEMVYEHTDISDLISDFSRELKMFTGCDAVGIRVLDEDGNIPYQAFDGFSTHFYDMENLLSIKSDHCMCINVIKGDTDPGLPFYTPGGSFYINGTTRFLSTVSEADKGETRNTCNQEGYESVALVPFKSGGRIMGLIHVADHRENMVPLPLVELLEKTVMLLGTAFQRANAQMKLKESEERLRAIIDNAGGVVWVKNLKGEYIVANSYMLNILEKTKDEVVGHTTFDMFPPALARILLKNDSRVIDAQVPMEFEENIMMDDGPHTFLSVKFPLYDQSGSVQALGAVCTDITRIKKVEASLKEQEWKYRKLSQEYRVLLDNVPDGIVHLSMDMKIRWINTAAKRIFNLDDETIITDKVCYDTFWGDSKCCESCPVIQCMSSGKNEIGDFTSRTDNRKFEIRAVPVNDEHGDMHGVIEIIRDITAHRRLEEQLRQAQKMESIGTFAGGIAHDFNNILSTIIGYSELALEEMDAGNPNRENVNMIMEAGLRASHLTKDLLLFSRKQTGDKHLIDINLVITKIEKFIRRIIGEDIRCSTRLSKEPLMVQADAHQIEQVLMNLATNSRDSMPGGGEFTISTEIVQQDDDYIRFNGLPYVLMTVADSGKGMDPKTAEKVFEPFFTTKEPGKGTGLGLAVVYGIIKDHQGYIHVQSEPDRGTAFRIYLPQFPVKEIDSKKETADEKTTGGNETILLVEDEAQVRRLFVQMLKWSGYVVIEAVDGEDAVKKFKEHEKSIRLIICDMVMPGLDGKQTITRIREIKPDVKGFFVSGNTPDHLKLEVQLNLQMDILYKPLSKRELLKKVRDVLDRP